jgi:thioredoxin-related protein
LKKLIIFLLLIQIFISLFGCQSKNFKYGPGKDTVEIFGDGTYQILRIVDEDLKEHKVLYNNEKQESVVENVLDYKEHKSLLYVVGDNKFTVLDYEKNKVKQYKNIQEIPDKDREIFKTLKTE